MEYPGVRLGQRGGLYDLYQYYLGGGDESQDTGSTGPVTTVPVTTSGGDQTNTMGVDLNRITQPSRTANPFRTDIPNVTDTGEKFSDLLTTDPRYMSQAEMRFQQNRADAGAYAYDSPMYSGGASGNITQTGPGREFIYDNTGKSYDDMAIMTGVEDEDPSLMAKIRGGILDNPLFTAVSGFFNPGFALARTAGKGILDAFGNLLPVNARAIQEKEGLTQGLAIDDIGRVAFQDFGIKEDGKYGALGRDDVRNIFAGLNYSMIDQSTIDKMIDRIEKGSMSDDGKKKRIDIINQAWNIKQMSDSEAQKIINKKEYERREKKREKIQKDLAAAGFGESGAVGIDKDMDKRIFDDYSYTPPSRKPVSTAGQAGPPSQRGVSSVSTAGQAGPPSQRGVSSVSTAGQAGPPSQRGGASYSSRTAGTSAGKSSSRGRTDGGWGWKDGGLVQRKPYGDGGIVDLL